MFIFRYHKVLITKILLLLMWGILWYFVAKHIYLWQRKKRGITSEINLGYCLLVSFSITVLPWLLIIMFTIMRYR